MRNRDLVPSSWQEFRKSPIPVSEVWPTSQWSVTHPQSQGLALSMMSWHFDSPHTSSFLRFFAKGYTLLLKLYGKIVIRIGWVKYVVSKRAIAVTKNIKVVTLNVKHQVLFIQLKFVLCNKNISLPKTNTTITHLHSLRRSIFSHFERSARETLTTSSGKTLCEKMLI